MGGFGAPHIKRIFAREGELRKFKRVGTQRRGLSRWYQLVGGRHGVGDDGGHLQQKVIRQRIDLRPGPDIRPVDKLLAVVCFAKAVIDLLFIEIAAELIGFVVKQFPITLSRGQHAAVGRGGGDRARVHQRDGGNLSLSRL